MQTEDLILNDCGKGQIIEQIGQELPHICVTVFSHTLVVETVNLGDLPTFMVTSQNSDSVGISDFQTH